MTTDLKLAAFVEAQDAVYEQVLRELSAGRKETHWIWFIFPQMLGLGFSHMAKRFGIASEAEAREYLKHEILGARLRQCTLIMLGLPGKSLDAILGYPDDLKFRSCMTLFLLAGGSQEIVFKEAIHKYCDNQLDRETLKLIGGQKIS